MGPSLRARSKGLAVSSTSRRMLIISTQASTPPISGETTQLATIWPIFAQFTASTPMPTTPKPTMAPTIVWVVDTGQPRDEATISQIPAASSAANMPKTNISGFSEMGAGSMIPLRIVLVTCPPARKAPANSNRAAITIAWRAVIAPEPTEVPMALATSFAPIPQVM